jgi:protein-tyrosine-phosphatase
MDLAPTPATPTHRERPWASRGRLHEAALNVAKKLVPRTWVQEVRRYRRFSKAERGLYFKIRITNGIRLRGSTRQAIPKSARSFVFVCFGNIMRSPMCEALFRRVTKPYSNLNLDIVSAGLNAAAGTPPHPWAVSAAKKMEISLEGYRAKPLSRIMVDRADAILAMDYQNQVELLSRYPDAADKFFLLGCYAGTNSRPIEIRDPFFGSEEETVSCYHLLQTCTQNLADCLFGNCTAPQEMDAKPERLDVGEKR